MVRQDDVTYCMMTGSGLEIVYKRHLLGLLREKEDLPADAVPFTPNPVARSCNSYYVELESSLLFFLHD